MDDRIEPLQRIASARDDVIALGGGLPSPELFPREALERAFSRALARSSAPLQYGWPEGSEALRRWIADRLRARGAPVTERDIIVTSGAQQALSICAEILIAERRATSAQPCVGFDRESYPSAIERVRTQGGRVVSLEEYAVISQSDRAFAYLMPGVRNPRGDTLTEHELRAVLALGAPVVADEAYAELHFSKTLCSTLAYEGARDRVFLVGTFSKTLCPGLRVGFLVAPPAWHEAALAAKRSGDLQASSLAQGVLEEFLARDDFDARLAHARRFYAERCALLGDALARELPSWRVRAPEGGFCLYVETAHPGDDVDFLSVATRHGVSFDPGSLFRIDEAKNPVSLRVCFSSVERTQLVDGARRLARAFRDFIASTRGAGR